jgi:hypothetical protein
VRRASAAVAGNECTDIGRWALARALDSNADSALAFLTDNRWSLHPRAEELYLSDAKLTDADASVLCAALRFNKVATELRLCQNRFSHFAIEVRAARCAGVRRL